MLWLALLALLTLAFAALNALSILFNVTGAAGLAVFALGGFIEEYDQAINEAGEETRC